MADQAHEVPRTHRLSSRQPAQPSPGQDVTSVQAFQGRRGCSARPLAAAPSADAIAGQDSKKSFNGLSSVLVVPSTDMLSRANLKMAIMSSGRPKDRTGTSDASSTRLRSP